MNPKALRGAAAYPEPPIRKTIGTKPVRLVLKLLLFSMALCPQLSLRSRAGGLHLPCGSCSRRFPHCMCAQRSVLNHVAQLYTRPGQAADKGERACCCRMPVMLLFLKMTPSLIATNFASKISI